MCYLIPIIKRHSSLFVTMRERCVCLQKLGKTRDRSWSCGFEPANRRLLAVCCRLAGILFAERCGTFSGGTTKRTPMGTLQALSLSLNQNHADNRNYKKKVLVRNFFDTFVFENQFDF